MNSAPDHLPSPIEGILLVNKPKEMVSFRLVSILRRLLGVSKIGHAGTLDPFASGVMVMLIGKKYTKMSDQFLHHDKAYQGCIQLGKATNTYDGTGEYTNTSSYVPSQDEIDAVLEKYQGAISQVPPMFSAKKVQGKKLYELARKGKEIERKSCQVYVEIKQLSYTYPYLNLSITCSKGTYIRSLAHDIGKDLLTFGHLTQLVRTRSGPFTLDQCIDGAELQDMKQDAVRKNILDQLSTTI